MKPVRLFMMAKIGDLVNLCKFVTRYFTCYKSGKTRRAA